jgi:hypothetical protein
VKDQQDLKVDLLKPVCCLLGICHSDIHTVREEWGKKVFPIVPGHEIGKLLNMQRKVGLPYSFDILQVVKSLKWDLKLRNSQLATSSASAALLILAEAATTADAGYVSYQE